MEHPQKKETKPPRQQRLGRRARVLLLLLAALVLAAALVVLLPAIRTRFPSLLWQREKANLTFRTLDTADVSVLDTVTVRQTDGDSYTLRYRSGKFYLAGADGADQLVNESYTDAIIAAATVIAVEDTVTEDAAEVADYLADMGLVPPAITVTVSYASGRTDTLELGATVPGTTYHYFRWSGGDGLYMCDIGTYEAFEYTAQMLLPVTQPTLVPQLIDRLTIRTPAAGTLALTFVVDGTQAYLGTVREPYHYPMDSQAAAALMSALQNLRLGVKVGTVDETNRVTYGFDAPAAVLDIHQQQGLTTAVDAAGALTSVQTQEQTIRLTFGKQDGEFFYFCQYAGDCYRVSRFLAAPLIAVSADACLTRAPADMGSVSIASIQAQTGDGALDVRAVYTEHVLENNQIEKDENGDTVYDISVTANGVPITVDAFNALTQRLQQMTVSGRLDAAQTPTGAPRWQLAITTTGGVTRTLAAYPLDAFSDVLTVDGVAMHFISAEAIRIALAELYPTAIAGSRRG